MTQFSLVCITKKMKVKVLEGLPQGCCLSRVLCDFYHAKMVSLHLNDLTQEDAVIIRIADDLLFLTTSVEKAQDFSSRISNGIYDFSCFFNMDETIKCWSSDREIISMAI